MHQRGTASDRGAAGQGTGAARSAPPALGALSAAMDTGTTPVTTDLGERARATQATGLEYARVFAREGVDPFDEIEWDIRSALIGNEKGELVFEQRDVEV